jgi:nitroreductase
MNVFDAIRTRKSVRKFLDKPIEGKVLVAILEAGRLAPSASNRQEWRFVVVENKASKVKLAKAANDQSFVGEASMVIAACAVTDEHEIKCGKCVIQ